MVFGGGSVQVVKDFLERRLEQSLAETDYWRGKGDVKGLAVAEAETCLYIEVLQKMKDAGLFEFVRESGPVENFDAQRKNARVEKLAVALRDVLEVV